MKIIEETKTSNTNTGNINAQASLETNLDNTAATRTPTTSEQNIILDNSNQKKYPCQFTVHNSEISPDDIIATATPTPTPSPIATTSKTNINAENSHPEKSLQFTNIQNPENLQSTSSNLPTHDSLSSSKVINLESEDKQSYHRSNKKESDYTSEFTVLQELLGKVEKSCTKINQDKSTNAKINIIVEEIMKVPEDKRNDCLLAINTIFKKYMRKNHLVNQIT